VPASHATQLLPSDEEVPAAQAKQLLGSSFMYSPGPQYSHLDAPALLKPAAPHDVHESTEPVLNVLAGQLAAPTLSSPSIRTSSPAPTAAQ
jgi:hypothetical protein